MIRKLAVVLSLVVVALATPSSALLVQPVYLDMRYTGIRSNGGLRVVNDRNRPVSVEVTVASVEIPELGPPIFTPVDGDDFLIFPAVGNIPANGTQIFRVRWVGDVGEESQLFALTTSELPVEIDSEARAAIQLLYAVQTVVAIGPETARPDITVVEVERSSSSSGQTGVRIVFENRGNLHGQVSQGTMVLRSGDWSRTMTPADMGQATGLGLVKSNGRRVMFIPIDDLPADGAITADLSLPQVR